MKNLKTLSYLHKLRCIQGDAESTFHIFLLPPSGRIGLCYPHYTERKPGRKTVPLLTQMCCFLFILVSQVFRHRLKKQKMNLTCLVLAFPKLFIYISYSLTGGMSRRENVMEKSRSIKRSSSVLRFLLSENIYRLIKHYVKQLEE